MDAGISCLSTLAELGARIGRMWGAGNRMVGQEQTVGIEPRSELGQTTVHALREEVTRVGSTLYEVGVAVTDVPWPRAIEEDVEPTPDGVGCFGIGRNPGT